MWPSEAARPEARKLYGGQGGTFRGAGFKKRRDDATGLSERDHDRKKGQPGATGGGKRTAQMSRLKTEKGVDSATKKVGHLISGKGGGELV